jgi:hypothetical protein
MPQSHFWKKKNDYPLPMPCFCLSPVLPRSVWLPLIELPASIRKCSQVLREAWSNEKDIIKESFPHQEEELLQSIENCNMQDDKSKGNIVCNIRKSEDFMQMFNKLKFI